MARRRALRGSIRASTPDREKISPIGARPIRLANPARNFSGVGPGRLTAASCTTAPPPIPKESPGAKKRSGCGGMRRRRNGQATMCRITSRPNRPTTKRNRARRAWMRFPEPRLSSCGRMASVGSSCRRAWWTGRCRRTTNQSSRRLPIRSTNNRRARSINIGRLPATSWRRWAIRSSLMS